MNELLEQLATRGSERGADAVLAAAIATIDDAGDGDGDGGAGAAEWTNRRDLQILTPEPIDGPPVVNMEHERPKRRRPWRTALTAGGLAAMLGVVSLGVSSLLGGSGSNSPEGAVRQLADAIEHEDPLAAVDVLAPAEIAALRESVDGISRRAAELALVDDASRPLAGIDFSVGDLELQSEELAPGFAKVHIDGFAINVEAHRDGVADLVRRAWAGDEAVARSTADLLDVPPEIGTFVVAVQHDDGWYVSPAYTALEYVRVANGLPAADFGSGRAAVATLGADTPDAAVQDALTAFAAGNWSRLWELAPPAELPVYDYRVALDEALAETEASNFTIDAFSATSTITGDHAEVTVDANGRSEDGTSTWSIDAQCFTVSDDDISTPFDRVCGRGQVFGTFTWFGSLFVGAGEGETLRVTAVQREGRWFVSPVGTVLDIVDAAARGLDEQKLLAAMGLYEDLSVDRTASIGAQVTGTSDHLMSLHVYTFDGTAGQRIVGELAIPDSSEVDDQWYISGAVIQPDGTEAYDSYELFEGPGVTLRDTGPYRLVLWIPTTGTFSFTLYDAENAPAELLERQPDDYIS